jgi:hypothetical protein
MLSSWCFNFHCAQPQLSPRFTLFLVGYLWMLAIPSPRLGRGTYIDENALGPGQVCRNTLQLWEDAMRLRLTLIGTGEMFPMPTDISSN